MVYFTETLFSPNLEVSAFSTNGPLPLHTDKRALLFPREFTLSQKALTSTVVPGLNGPNVPSQDKACCDTEQCPFSLM